MIKFKQFEFRQLGEYTWKYDIYRGEDCGVCLSVFIRKWIEAPCYEVSISGRGIEESIPGECEFSTYAEAEAAAKFFIEKMLLQHVEME